MQENNRKVDIIIPAYKAQNTILRTLSSIAMQSILDDIEVTIVNDCCPNGDYKKFVTMFSPFFKIREIKMQENGGPGLARQHGIDNTQNAYFTCIDADDTFADAFSVESMRAVIEQDKSIVCACGVFLEVHDGLQIMPHENDMVWMFGKLYRRDFIQHFGIRFNSTRANEDTGFNTKVRLLCANTQERLIAWFPKAVYCWHEKFDSITRINDCQYSYDQSFCGWTDNMIDAIQFARKVQPFNGEIDKCCLANLLHLYTYYIETVARNPVFAAQNWEFVKKYYNTCYKSIEHLITEEVFNNAYSEHMQNSWGSGRLNGIRPKLTIDDFLDKLHTEVYNENDIYDVWAAMPQELIQNNIKCGVCSKDYTKKKQIVDVST